ncbi:MAG: ATPase AAA [Candidatus Bathyarchaeota archaeon B63]|nr:MAG: ATPase AAA [Candidatus Bathyarchaeota archaeon B63]
MKNLGTSPGDPIEITGKRTTALLAWKAYPEDQDEKIIRIDDITCNNAGVGYGEFVEVRKAEVKDAEVIRIQVTSMDFKAFTAGLKINLDEEFAKFVKDGLLQRVLRQGDSVTLVMLGAALKFTVLQTEPTGTVRVTNSTNIQVLTKPQQIR